MKHTPCLFLEPLVTEQGSQPGVRIQRFGVGATTSAPRWSKEAVEERRRFVRDAHDLVGRLAVELEIELRFRAAVVPFREGLEFAPPKAVLSERRALDPNAPARRLPGDAALLRDRLGKVTTPRAIRPWPRSFSLANTKIVSPLTMCLPPYIVFCATKAKAFARALRTSALIANAISSLALLICRRPLGVREQFDMAAHALSRRERLCAVSSVLCQWFVK
jgi:hypothetical protein